MAGDEVSLLIGEYRRMFGEELREAMKKSKGRDGKVVKKTSFERSSSTPAPVMSSPVKGSPGRKKGKGSPQREHESVAELKLQLEEANIEKAALQKHINHLQDSSLGVSKVFSAAIQTICSAEERVRENIEWCMHEERTSLSTMLAATMQLGFDYNQLARLRTTNERLQTNLYKVEQYDTEVRHRSDAECSIAVLQQSLLQKEITILKCNPDKSNIDTQTEVATPQTPPSVPYERVHQETAKRFIVRLLKGVYARHDPKKVPRCTDEAKVWVGKEEDLFRVLSNAYGLKVSDFAKIMKKQDPSPARERSSSTARHSKPVSCIRSPSTSVRKGSPMRNSTPTRSRRSRSVDINIGTPVRPTKHFSSSRAPSPSKLLRPPKPSLVRVCILLFLLLTEPDKSI